jgi:Cu+-exporting ATPase
MSIKNRFIVSLVASLPMLIMMIAKPFGLMLHGDAWIMFVLTTIVMAISARQFIESAWASFKNHHANMDTLVAVGTLVTYVYSIFALLTGRAVFFESAAFVVTFVLLGQVFEERMRNSASSAVEKLVNLQAKEAEVLRDGNYIQVPIDEVQLNDEIRVKPGQKVALDGVITSGKSSINEAMVTGESMPVSKSVDDHVIGSTLNIDGTFTFKVTKVGDDTMLAQIVELVKKAQSSHAPIQKTVDQIANVFVPVVMILSILTFAIWYGFLDSSVVNAMLFAVSVIIIACPCALGIATPTALMVGTGRSAKLGILIKNGEVLEAVNQITTVVFDKTGTITEGAPKVTDVVGDAKQVMEIATALEASSEHPLARAILDDNQNSQYTVTDFQSIEGRGVQGKINGQDVFVGSPKLAATNDFEADMIRLQNEAKTVVAVGQKQTVIGLIAIQDMPKETAKAAMAALHQRGLKTVMLTGDNELVAGAIANQVGIDTVIANVLPKDKANEVEHLQQHESVAFVGDGINDAPALATANVGIAMGSGTDVAIESGDIVLVKNDLMDVVNALELSKKTFNRIKLNLFWAFIYNAIGIPIAAGIFVGLGLTLSPELAGLGMALSSISVVGSSLLLNKTKLAV